MIVQLAALLAIVALVYRHERKLYRHHMTLTHREITSRLYPRSGNVTPSSIKAPASLTRSGADPGGLPPHE